MGGRGSWGLKATTAPGVEMGGGIPIVTPTISSTVFVVFEGGGGSVFDKGWGAGDADFVVEGSRGGTEGVRLREENSFSHQGPPPVEGAAAAKDLDNAAEEFNVPWEGWTD